MPGSSFEVLEFRAWLKGQEAPKSGSIEVLTVVGGQQPNGGVGVSLAH